ncbi:MAG TPA: hypothetical protein VD997_16600 [Phycisphaerales bacterium]|nr:hypothetical protein [Phycisphaerales bacterium]
MGPLSRSARWWLAGVVLAFILGALAWPLIGDRFADRHLDLSLTARGDGPLELQWLHAGGRNGCWIDLKDQLLRQTPTPEGGRALRITQWLPSYKVDELGVRADQSTRVEVVKATVRPRVLGVRLPSRDVTSESKDRLLPLPPLWRETLWPGAVLTGAGAAALTLLAWLITVELLRLEAWRACREANQPDPHAHPRARGWTIATIAVSVTAPALMGLWAPMFLLADSTAYLWFVHDFLKNPTLNHFDGWRLPGYALFIAPLVAWTTDYATWVGIAHAALGALTSLLVLAMLRPRLRAPWPQLAAMLVAIDPLLLAWQRVVMTETLSTLLITLAAWLFLKMTDDAAAPALDNSIHTPTRPRSWQPLLLAIPVGLVCGYSCTVRGNNQIIPVILAVGALWMALKFRRPALIPAAAAILVGAAVVVWPLIRLNQINHNQTRLSVAVDFPKAVFAWDMALVDWNQSGLLTFSEFQEMRNELRTSPVTSWDVMDWIGYTRSVPVPANASNWMRREIRTGALAREARARRGGTFTLRQLQSVVILLGIPLPEPHYAMSSTMGVFRQLRGKPNESTPTNLDFDAARLPPDIRALVERSVRDVSWMEGHPGARAFGTYFKACLWVRAVIAVAFIASLARLLLTRRHAMATLGLLVLANAVAIPLLTYGCEYRFAAPFVPLTIVVALYGLLAPARTRAALPA